MRIPARYRRYVEQELRRIEITIGHDAELRDAFCDDTPQDRRVRDTMAPVPTATLDNIDGEITIILAPVITDTALLGAPSTFTPARAAA